MCQTKKFGGQKSVLEKNPRIRSRVWGFEQYWSKQGLGKNQVRFKYQEHNSNSSPSLGFCLSSSSEDNSQKFQVAENHHRSRQAGEGSISLKVLWCILVKATLPAREIGLNVLRVGKWIGGWMLAPISQMQLNTNAHVGSARVITSVHHCITDSHPRTPLQIHEFRVSEIRSQNLYFVP